MPSFLDYLSVPDVQAATQQAVVTQQANHLSVTPKPVLGPIIQRAMTNYRAVNALDRARQRLSILSQGERFNRRMEPFAIGLGAADLGVSILGGIHARQQASEREAGLRRLEAIESQGLQQQRQFTNQYQDALRDMRHSILRQAILPAPEMQPKTPYISYNE